MYCNNCGKEVPDNAAFCEHCGTKFTKSRGKAARTPSSRGTKNPGKKKLLIIAAALCCTAAAAVAIAASLFLQNPKKKVLIGTAKTFQAALTGDTSLGGVLGIDQILKEISQGNVIQLLNISFPENGTGVRALVLSDQKNRLARGEISPTWNNMELAQVVVYKQENLVYCGLPDVLDDVYYVDLKGMRDDYSGSALDRLIQENTGQKLAEVLPEENLEKDISYKKYCEEELGSLYDSIEVEKDGKESIRIDGKSQNCDRYYVTIPGSNVKTLLSASLDYLWEEKAAFVYMADIYYLYMLKNELPSIRFRDFEMTVCLDKKGRLVSCKGEWALTYEGDTVNVEYNGTFTGGSSPFDKIRGSVILSDQDNDEIEITLNREKNFQKKSSLKDEMELTLVETYGSYSYIDNYTYDFSYNLQNGKWSFTIADDYPSGIQAEGQISNVKKGKELSLTLNELTDLSGRYCYLEGKYELSGLGKEGISPLDGAESGISLFDMSKAELMHLGEELNDKWLFSQGTSISFPSSLFNDYGYSESATTAATTAASSY